MEFDKLLDTYMGDKKNPEPTEDEPEDEPEDEKPEIPQDVIAEHRKRLAALAAGGKAKEYIGQNFTAKQIEGLPDSEIETLYLQHEMRLGSLMTGSVGRMLLQLYALAASRVVPIVASYTHPGSTVYVDKLGIVEDLEHDPIVNRLVNNVSCELYHSYGWSIGPATLITTTIKRTNLTYAADGGDAATTGDTGGIERS